MFAEILLQASAQFENITNTLEEQHKIHPLLEMVSGPRYIEGIEKIEDLFIAVMKGLTFLL
jgi:hypothetical protein